jgi:hypothetical protein
MTWNVGIPDFGQFLGASQCLFPARQSQHIVVGYESTCLGVNMSPISSGYKITHPLICPQSYQYNQPGSKHTTVLPKRIQQQTVE